ALSTVILSLPHELSLPGYGDHRDLHSFPTRRSSDLPWHTCSLRRKAKKAPLRSRCCCMTRSWSGNLRCCCWTRKFPLHDRVMQRSEEHTSELQSRENLVCRLLLEKKKKQKITKRTTE